MLSCWCEFFKAVIVFAYRFACVHISTLIMILIGLLLLYKYNITFRRTVWFFYQQFAIVGIGLVWCTLILPVLWLRQQRFENIQTLARLAKPLSNLIGIRHEIRNKENMPTDNMFAVLISNHPSRLVFLSILYAIGSMKMLCAVTAASNILWSSPLGWVLHLCRCCLIERTSSLQSANRKIDRLADTVQEEKIKMWFFPDGSTAEELSPFKESAFRIAIDRKVPIVPVVFSPHSFVDWNNLQAEEGKIIIDILSPISTAEYTPENMNLLIEKTQALISRRYAELAEEIRSERNENAE